MIECLEKGSNILQCIIFDCKATFQSLAIACAHLRAHLCIFVCAPVHTLVYKQWAHCFNHHLKDKTLWSHWNLSSVMFFIRYKILS